MPKRFIACCNRPMLTDYDLEIDELFKNKKVDPNDEHEWLTLLYGFLLGKGLKPTAAYELALHQWYHVDRR